MADTNIEQQSYKNSVVKLTIGRRKNRHQYRDRDGTVAREKMLDVVLLGNDTERCVCVMCGCVCVCVFIGGPRGLKQTYKPCTMNGIDMNEMVIWLVKER